MAGNKAKRLLMALAVAVAGIPLITTATCDPYYGVFDFYRDDDYGRDGGVLDWLIGDLFYDDCYYDCYDDYYYDDYYDEIVIWP